MSPHGRGQYKKIFLSPDWEQREQGCLHDHSFVVQAMFSCRQGQYRYDFQESLQSWRSLELRSRPVCCERGVHNLGLGGVRS